jgi:hypothetical protein
LELKNGENCYFLRGMLYSVDVELRIKASFLMIKGSTEMNKY